ncbi:hypothetical protein [Mycobacterium intracellulare]|uniref:Uncharacterized protein n=1 Tax=Mycobacterium intracellulare TaxID=1767 RepID=A0AAE4REA4_MYCIT|nr:hypothetical protein [Mycobacterium intracellulare]MDV6979641.1 hypothetical protein [Mycobacterium intracellulare]MDV6985144.1 hypothetical protein [Mycobacterium intracellulare]MDV7014236.1 hypothetical protein [Mycobacterium intracellulare]MDV7030135.1 hypothetical protein [Mycobacterium intracellulare]
MTTPTAQRAIEHIAARLAAGIVHPGNPDTNQPAKLIALPGLSSTGIPPEMAQHFANEAGLPANDAPRLVAEAILHLLDTELGLELIPASELRQLQAQVAEPDTTTGAAINIHCRCNPSRALLTVSGRRSMITTDGAALRQRLDQVCTCT